MARPHRHVWHDDGLCKCGETHPVILALMERVDALSETRLIGSRDDIGQHPLEVTSEPPDYRISDVTLRYAINGTWSEELPADLLSAVEAPALTPQQRAKIVRVGFAARGWPDTEHPGTVRDFLEEHGVPIA
jgi:hypothetical protein